MQERGARYQVVDELRISAPSLDDRAWIHLCSLEEQGSCSLVAVRRFSCAAAAAAAAAALAKVLGIRKRCCADVDARLLQPDFGITAGRRARPPIHDLMKLDCGGIALLELRGATVFHLARPP